ncbi:hypothetical protein G7054_g14740 [Neopestalotiopsis clavispora]|nr:hypothetical protein G7054_g14740 [Neopestalotiopsis clavispora]
MGIYWHQSITKASVHTPPSSNSTRSSKSVNIFGSKRPGVHQEWQKPASPDEQFSGDWIAAYRKAGNQQEEILDWLSATHSTEVRRQTTGKWLLACPEFQTWLESPGGILFCPGLPGAGKTMITSIVVNHLHGLFAEDPNVGICYICCDEDFRGKNTIPHLLFLLVKQLIQRHQKSFDSVAEMKSEFEIERRQPQEKDLLNILRTLIGDLDQTFIILDAVDELENPNDSRQGLLQQILNLQAGLPINLFATSRFRPNITRMFRATPTKVIRGEQNITVYLDSYFPKLPELVRHGSKVQNQIRPEIEQAAGGNFVLATKLLELCAEIRSTEEVKHTLLSKNTPFSALHAAWHDRIHRVVEPRRYRELARRALMWTTCAQWSLTASELQHALAVELDKDVLRPTNIPSLEDILSAGAGFLCIESGTGTVKLAHASVKEYLLQSQWFPDAHEMIAKTCATYLLLDDFADGHLRSDEALQRRFQSFPLYVYASCNWAYHTQLSSLTPSMERVVQRLAESSAHVQAWHQAIVWYLSKSTLANPTPLIPGNVNALHTAALLDLETFICLLLDKTQMKIDVEDGQGRTPLSYAAERGSLRTVERLVAHSAKIEAKDINGAAPLLWALRYQHDTVVKFLLWKGAKFEVSVTVEQLPALAYASRWGLVNSVQGLLEAGVRLNETDGEYQRTALMWAAINGHETVVQALLMAGLEIDMQDSFGRTALIWAAMNGHTPVVEVLLKKKADRRIKDFLGRTALSMASWMGFETIVRLLIGSGAGSKDEDEHGDVDIEAIDDVQRRSALSLAAEGGHLSIVVLLVERGANVDCRSNLEQTPLFFAANNEHLEIVDFLLRHGADPCFKDIFDQTPRDRSHLRGKTMIQPDPSMNKKAVVHSLLDRVGDRDSDSSMLLSTNTDATHPNSWCGPYEMVVGKAGGSGFISEWFSGSIPFISMDETTRARSQQLILRSRGVKQTIVRFLFDYDDELRNELHTADYMEPDNHFIPGCVTGKSDGPIDAEKAYQPTSTNHQPSVVISREAVDETEIFGIKSEPGGQTHLATHRMQTNLSEQVNDILLESIQATSPGNFRRIQLLVDTGMIHLIQYQETKSLARLQEAISVTRQALTEMDRDTTRLQPRDGADSVDQNNLRGVVLANLAIQLDQLYRRTARFPALGEAIKSTRAAIDTTTRHIQRYRLIYLLGTQLQARYATIGDRTDLEEAIALNREALISLPPNRRFTRNRIAVLNNLASLLADRSAETGHDDDRETALELMRKVIGIIKNAPNNVINSHACAAIWNNMSSIYTEKFLRNDDLESLADAIEFSQKASEVALENSVERPVILSHYAILRCMECEWLPKNFNNLNDSVNIAHQATKMTQALSGNASRTAVLYNLGNAYLYSYRSRKDNHSEITVPEEIVQEVVRAAAAYAKDGEEVLKCRLKDYGPGVVTETVLKTAVKNIENGDKVLRILLDACGQTIDITKEVIEAAAGNSNRGDKVMALLFQHSSDKILLTDAAIRAAIQNETTGSQILAILIQQSGEGKKRKRNTFDGILDQQQPPVTRAPAHRHFGSLN